MSTPRLNILRNLRVQMKTGFLREQPIEYNYLRRFPPLSRDTLPASFKTKEIVVPYVNLYHKAVAKNPMYLDEKVYPAFGYQEPQALVLAKRQYQFMQEGLTEELAYNKALEYIAEMEDKSFQELKKVQDTLEAKGATLPFLADPAVASQVEEWQNKLKEVPYNELRLSEQGELDHFVQTKILKWNEVERERRMKDPVFVMQFKKLVDSIFPKTVEQKAHNLTVFQKAFREKFLNLYNHDSSKLNTTQPFFVEDYLKYVARALEQPFLQNWQPQEREEFSKWIIDTLAFRDAIEGRSAGRIQKYLDSIRDQFFPMLRFPQRAAELDAASVEQVKALLYANEVGYKKMDGKLFVQRFYRLPFLLFPRDVLCTNISLNERSLTRVLESDEVLLNELKSHGVEANLEDVQRQLSDYHAELVANRFTHHDEIDMSILDDILGEEKSDRLGKEQSASVAKSNSSGSSTVQSHLNLKVPKTLLEQERHKFFSQVELQVFENIQNQDDIEQFKKLRLENELIVRAKLAKEYEMKESARRVVEWEKRGLWTSELPLPNVPLVEC